ncbi:pirin family protein [Hymenobacter wooponensis]|uniref:Pirin family protein n=1 Tax=Hymenobacter wooponensis TaxID=1525360 RepID=A0A4Z0MCS0_9BACT|nr:pirin family protein [Hymenobacter wooponensis]TGD77542.1 pirin family protein [Hymenobacter wooponensis]
MTKSIIAQIGGTNATVGKLLVNRLLPSRMVAAVGPFVFLDHVYPTHLEPQVPKAPTGETAHPHRGIATFTYVLSGALEHYDSAGHHGEVAAGGAQWMKAGRGVLHDENPSLNFQATGGVLHALQFWINLPARYKAEAPAYLALQPTAVPEVLLPESAGRLRVLLGALGDAASPVPTSSPQFLYHLQLSPKASFSLATKAGLDYAAFVPAEIVQINGQPFGQSELVLFGHETGPITFTNPSIGPVSVLVFGGEPSPEPMVAQGPFVMNSHAEIATAYEDFFAGDYGQIYYEPVTLPQDLAPRTTLL